MKRLQSLSYKTLFTILFLALAGIVFFLKIGGKTQKVSAAWWNEMWHYRKVISITNSGAAQTNTQIKILDNYDLSALVTAGKIQSDLNDLRFTDINGNLIKYWIEDATNNSVDIWGFIPSSPTSGATIYMYYGNSSASPGKTITGTSDYPGVSCQSIKLSGISTDGIYYIDPTAQETSDKFQAYCDMTTDGGGWTLSLRLNTNDSDTQEWNSSFWTSSSEQGSITNNNDYLSPSYYTLNGWDKILIDYRYTSGQAKKMAAVFSGSNNSTLKSQTTMTLNNNNPDWVRTYTNNSEAASWYGLNLKFQTVGNGNDNTRIWYNRVAVSTCNQNGGIGVCGDCSVPNLYSEVSPPCSTTSCQWNGSCGVAGVNGKEYNVNCSKTLPADAYDEGIMYVLIKESVISTAGHTVTVSDLSSEELGGGPIAYWKFDEGSGTTAYDSTTNQNNCTLGTGNSAPTWTNESQCISGKCLSFDGNDYLGLTDTQNSSLDIKNQITMSVWVRPTSSSNLYYLISKNSSGGYSDQQFSIAIDADNNQVNAYVNGTGVSHSFNNYDTWSFISATWDGSYLRLYQNGKLLSTASYSGTLTFKANFSIGRRSNSTDGTSSAYTFYGYLDDVKIYPYARTADQIKQDYNSRGSMSGSSVNLGVRSNTAPSLKSSLVAHYKFDEGNGTIAYDSSGNNYSGIMGNGTSSPVWANGKINKSLNYDGNDYMDTQNIPGLNNTFSISLWTKANNYSSTYNPLICRDGNTNNNMILRFDTSGNIEFRQYGGSEIRTNNSFPLDTWIHIVAISDNLNGKIYVNGKLEKEGTFPVSFNDTGNISFGKYSYSPGFYFNGLIDEVKIYNKALTPEEVKQDYNAGSVVQFGTTNQTIGGTTTSLEYCIPGDTSFCDSPVAEWNFEENTGTTVKDTSGNNFTGILSSNSYGPTWTTGKNNSGAGIKFNGESNSSYIGTSFPSTPPTSYTAEVWINPNSITNVSGERASYGYTILAASGSTTYYYPLWILLHNGEIRSYAFTSSTSTFGETVGANIQTNKWYHIAVSATQNGNVTIYVNGVGKTSFTAGNVNWDTTDKLTISDLRPTRNISFNGKIDSVKIYNYARTPAQIAYDYNKGAPVGWWKMDECQGSTINDSSGNNNFGTLSIGQSGTQNSIGTCQIGTSAAWTNGASGKINSSLNFDGVDDYGELSNNTQNILGNTTPEWSYSVWFKTNGAITVKKEILSNYDSSSGDSLVGIWTGINNDGNSGRIFINVRGANAPDYLYSPSGKRYDDNKWHNIIVTARLNNFVKGYIDGIEFTSASLGNTNYIDTAPLRIGALKYSGNITEFWSGQIDDVRIYNYALTSEQVKQVYNGGAVNFQ